MIKIKKANKGLLHKNLNVPAGEKIPASKLAIHSGDSEAIRKRKQFAINAKKWHHEEGGEAIGYNQAVPDSLEDPILRNRLMASLKARSFEVPFEEKVKTGQVEPAQENIRDHIQEYDATEGIQNPEEQGMPRQFIDPEIEKAVQKWEDSYVPDEEIQEAESDDEETELLT